MDSDKSTFVMSVSQLMGAELLNAARSARTTVTDTVT